MTSTKDSPTTATEDTSTSVLPTSTSQTTTTDPAQPADLPGDDDDDILAIDLSSLSISPPQPDSTTEQHITLPILQPLSTPAMLAACRDPSSRIVRMPNNRASDARGPELLDITPLGGAWRHALSKLPPPAAVTFDLTLPKPTATATPAEGEGNADPGADALPRVYWATSTGPAVDVAVEQVKVMRLVVTLASATWVRRNGKDVRFDVVYGADDEPSQRAVEGLRQQLDGIAGSARGEPTGAVQGV